MNAFCYCRKLRSVDFGSGIESIGRNAFYDDTAINSCTYRGSESAWKRVSIGEGNEALTAASFSFTTASTVGEGNVVLVLAIGSAAVIALIAAVVLKKKKTAAK